MNEKKFRRFFYLRVNFGYCGTRIVENGKVFCKIWCFFCRILAPAQRAAGGCSPPKVTPGRGLAARRIFFLQNWSKLKILRCRNHRFHGVFMSFPMKKSRVGIPIFGKTHFYFQNKNFNETPSHRRNQHPLFFTLEFFFGCVRNDPMCQKFFRPQTSTRVGDTVSLSYSVVKINNE